MPWALRVKPNKSRILLLIVCQYSCMQSFLIQQFVSQSVKTEAHVFGQAHASVVLSGRELDVQ